MAEITSCWILGAYCGQQCQLILVANRPKWVEIISEGAILFSIETIFGSVNDAVTRKPSGSPPQQVFKIFITYTSFLKCLQYRFFWYFCLEPAIAMTNNKAGSVAIHAK